jgi:hypothetical protein
MGDYFYEHKYFLNLVTCKLKQFLFMKVNKFFLPHSVPKGPKSGRASLKTRKGRASLKTRKGRASSKPREGLVQGNLVHVLTLKNYIVKLKTSSWQIKSNHLSN